MSFVTNRASDRGALLAMMCGRDEEPQPSVEVIHELMRLTGLRKREIQLS
jgi:hypothetical protein